MRLAAHENLGGGNFQAFLQKGVVLQEDFLFAPRLNEKRPQMDLKTLLRRRRCGRGGYALNTVVVVKAVYQGHIDDFAGGRAP